jgi:hypothetical protein
MKDNTNELKPKIFYCEECDVYTPADTESDMIIQCDTCGENIVRSGRFVELPVNEQVPESVEFEDFKMEIIGDGHTMQIMLSDYSDDDVIEIDPDEIERVIGVLQKYRNFLLRLYKVCVTVTFENDLVSIHRMKFIIKTNKSMDLFEKNINIPDGVKATIEYHQIEDNNFSSKKHFFNDAVREVNNAIKNKDFSFNWGNMIVE